MSKKYCTSREVNACSFNSKVTKLFWADKFSSVWKDATREYDSNLRGSNCNKRGYGADGVCQKYNKFLASPNDRKLKKMALHNAMVLRGEVGVSPAKWGKPPVIPIELTKGLATHATMMQVLGDQEASRQNMIVTVSALCHGTKWQDKIDMDWLWRKTRNDYPEILNPVRAKDHEDRRVDWLSYGNINDWTDRAKKFLVSLGMLKDEPGTICE